MSKDERKAAPVPQVNMGLAPHMQGAPQAPEPKAATRAASKDFTQNPGYVRKSRGFPVNEGETWHDLTAEQRRQWFSEHESRWKTRFGIQNRGLEANMSWTRG